MVSGLEHGGVDLGAPAGTPILAATGGQVPNEVVIGGDTVPGSGTRRSSGNYVVVVDSHGYFFYYFHLQSSTVSPGDRVTVGQLIGRMGNSGLAHRSRSAPVHLHFQAVNSLHHHGSSEEWYRDMCFPVRNLNNLDPFPELARLAATIPGASRTRSPVQGTPRSGFIIHSDPG